MKSVKPNALKQFFLIILITLSVSALAQTETLTNTSIIDLHVGKLSNSFIIDKIKNSTCNFDLSPDKLIELKKAKISEDIMKEMGKKPGNSTVQNLTLTNTSVMDLDASSFSKSFIIDKIKTYTCKFDLTTDKLIELKKAKISEDIIKEMEKKINNSSAIKTEVIQAPISNVTKAENPKTEAPKSNYKPPLNQPSGIYYLNTLTNELVEIDASVYSQTKKGSGILGEITYGFAKTKSKASLTGTTANLQIRSDTFPTFFFYFDKNRKNDLGENINTGGWYAAAATPNEFTIIKLLVPKNGRTREVVTGSYNIEGDKSGVDEAQNSRLTYEKVAPGVYKVFFPNALKPGEYCFMYAGTDAANKVYDFGIAK